MNAVIVELRGLRARTNITQTEIAERMGYSDYKLSRILGEKAPMPDDFESRFRSAVAELATEAAAQERAEADARARALLEAAGVEPEWIEGRGPSAHGEVELAA